MISAYDIQPLSADNLGPPGPLFSVSGRPRMAEVRMVSVAHEHSWFCIRLGETAHILTTYECEDGMIMLYVPSKGDKSDGK